MVGAAVATTATVGTVLPSTIDCSAMTADNGSNCGVSLDHGKARTTEVNGNLQGGNCHVTRELMA